MSLHKNDYLNIAQCIKNVGNACENDTERHIIEALAVEISNWCCSESRIFDRRLFLANCGIERL
jgi:hypothetical protein